MVLIFWVFYVCIICILLSDDDSCGNHQLLMIFLKHNMGYKLYLLIM